MSRIAFVAFLLCTAGSGCAAPRSAVLAPANNPMFVPVAHEEVVWERTVDMLHDYGFEVARENKLDGMIETQYKVGSGFLEPWHHDSVGHDNRLESTLQSIRRRVAVHITPADGGFLVSIEAFKELEDLPGIAANSAGGATFQEATPLKRDLNLVVGQSTPSGWLVVGRDPALEHDMLSRLQTSFSR
jgi:hypothetical protein